MPVYLTAKELILQVRGELTTDGATFCALEFNGDSIAWMEMYGRMTLTNIAIEVGAMNGIIAPDEKTEKFLKYRNEVQCEQFNSDEDAVYRSHHIFKAQELEPQIAKPHSPDNTDKVRYSQGTKITKCYIGSCTGGKISDYKLAAQILFDQRVKIPTFIIPSTTSVAAQMKTKAYRDKKLIDIFSDAGCTMAPPSCAACLGGPIDTTGRAVDFDVVISTTNRNFPGRMGSKKSEVYLASPLTVAASAVNGVITDPRDFLV